ncbi:hypothetical protein [Embleya sp. NPDC059259]|uniref:hypothetical protein n=1 Tax=unclassified Embleya TaxID=2699296 RepID=UPI0036909CDE
MVTTDGFGRDPAAVSGYCARPLPMAAPGRCRWVRSADAGRRAAFGMASALPVEMGIVEALGRKASYRPRRTFRRVRSVSSEDPRRDGAVRSRAPSWPTGPGAATRVIFGRRESPV